MRCHRWLLAICLLLYPAALWAAQDHRHRRGQNKNPYGGSQYSIAGSDLGEPSPIKSCCPSG